MTKHKSKNRHTGGGQKKGKLEQSREEGVSMGVRDLLWLEENGGCKVGTRAEARPLCSADLLENLVLF